MRDVVADLRAECGELDMLLRDLRPDQWGLRTAFFDWTIADQVMHLHLIDDFGIISLTEPERFPALVAEIRVGQARGYELSDRMRDNYGTLAQDALLVAWRDTWTALCTRFEASDPARRIPWFGPDMSVASFAAARQMEAWAHGQDICDRIGRRRPARDRLFNICDLGVRTFGWSFRNRGLDKPVAPEVRLAAPSGACWVWNEGAPEQVAGAAEDFALVVTQRAHLDDTALRVEGTAARQWMEIAQCFAGAAAEGPAPGERARPVSEGA